MSGANKRRQADRFEFVEGEGWYVRTREGRRGPFETRAQAEASLADLLRTPAPRHAAFGRSIGPAEA